MNAETIKDFLVSLGFSVDDAGAKKFGSVLAGTTANVIKMGLAVEGAALSVVAFTAKIASGLDNLYWASQRTGATVQGIQSIGYAVSQVGGSVDAARSSLESLSRFIRNNPGAEGFLNRLGVQTRDASGNMRDMAAIFTGVGQKLSSMPYYRANQYAQMLGIDENTLMAMRRGVGQFSAQYSEMVKAIGFNADQAALSSNRFMTSLKSLGEMAGMARDKIGSNLADGLAGQIDNLRKKIIENFPKIEVTITKVIKGILWLGEIVGRVAFRIVDILSTLFHQQSRKIGMIVPSVVISEKHTDMLEITEHPVEVGAAVADHAYKKPSEVVMEVGFAGGGALLDFASNLTATSLLGLSPQQTYQELLGLQESRIPFDVVTGKRLYSNMLIRALEVTTDKTTENVLSAVLTLREVIISRTQQITVADKTNMKEGASTSAVQNSGNKTTKPPDTSLLKSITGNVASLLGGG